MKKSFISRWLPGRKRCTPAANFWRATFFALTVWNPISLVPTVLAPTLLAPILLPTALWAATVTDQPGGWASLNGGTKGGAGGTEVTVTTMADLQKYAKMSGKYIIWVKGVMGSAGTSGSSDGDRIVVASDKSILGLPGAVINGGLDIDKSVSNIIVRNLKIQGPGALDVNGLDAVHVQDGVKNVWLDHLDISDGEDGNMDVSHACDYVTVSWTKFSYTSKSYASGTSGKSHRFCNLIGHSDKNAAEDSLHLLITFYKTWWADGIAERMPRVRFAQLHVANCLFTSKDPGQIYCIRACHRANILAESNSFIGQTEPIDTSFDPTFLAITVRNNYFEKCTGNTAGSGKSFTPTYAALAFTDPAQLQAELSDSQTGAGPTLTWGNTVSLALPSTSLLKNGSTPRIVDLTGRDLLPSRLREGQFQSWENAGRAVLLRGSP